MRNQIEFEKNSQGDILLAALRQGKGARMSIRFTLGGKREELYVIGRGPTNNDYYYGRGDFFEGSNKILTMTARIYLHRQSVALHLRDYLTHADYLIDFSKYSKHHLGSVVGAINGRRFEGSFDPRSNEQHVKWANGSRKDSQEKAKRTLSKPTLRVGSLMSDAIFGRLEPLGPVIEQLEARRVEQMRPYLQQYSRTLLNSDWLGEMGQHACWAFGSLGAGASCMTPAAPLTCAVGAPLFGAAASWCSKQVGPEPTGWVWHPDPLPSWSDGARSSVFPQPPDMGVPEEQPAPEEGPMSKPEEGLMSMPDYHVGVCTDEE